MKLFTNGLHIRLTPFQLRSPCFCLLLLWSTAQAQDFGWTPALQRTYTDLSSGKTPPPLAENPANGLSIFVADYADMVALLASDDATAFHRISNREDSRLDQLKSLDNSSPYGRLLQAEVRLHWAFMKLKFGEEVSASWDIIRAYKLLAENQKQFPTFLPTYKSLGALHVLIGSVPEKYNWVTRLLGLRGNVKGGIQEITRAEQDPVFGLEAQLINLLVRAYITRFSAVDEQALQRLVAANPTNLLVYFFAATTQMKNGQSEQALSLLLNRPGLHIPTTGYLALPIIENVLGDIYLQKGQYAEALTHYSRFLTVYRGRNFLKDTYYKQFLCYYLADNPAGGRTFIEQVPVVGQRVVESDKSAQKWAETYLKKGQSPNQPVLLKARLACDGGYTDTALALLRPYTEQSFPLTAERAEWAYRMGRIQQRRNQLDLAIPYLDRALLLSAPEQLGFGATAALQLGYIHQQKGQLQQARLYFEKALHYKNHEYKNSVDNKARAALNSLGVTE